MAFLIAGMVIGGLLYIVGKAMELDDRPRKRREEKIVAEIRRREAERIAYEEAHPWRP